MSHYRLVAMIVAAVLSASSYAVSPSPYAGQERRDIKSLSQQEVSDYLAGKGMGLAKAAELNGYPGPAHVLELADQLQLTTEQRRRTEALLNDMQSRAIAAGKSLVDDERALDGLFASKAITTASLKEAVDRVAAHQAQLRLVHLDTHLAQIKILSAEQIAKYNALRGYAGTATQEHHRKSH